MSEDLKQYAQLVRRMRQGQTDYFKLVKTNATPDSKTAALKTAKAREERVDRRTAAIIDGQLGLFR